MTVRCRDGDAAASQRKAVSPLPHVRRKRRGDESTERPSLPPWSVSASQRPAANWHGGRASSATKSPEYVKIGMVFVACCAARVQSGPAVKMTSDPALTTAAATASTRSGVTPNSPTTWRLAPSTKLERFPAEATRGEGGGDSGEKRAARSAIGVEDGRPRNFRISAIAREQHKNQKSARAIWRLHGSLGERVFVPGASMPGDDRCQGLTPRICA